jgi:hypothetical protein
VRRTSGWLLAIGLVVLCAFGSRCTSVNIGGETVKVFRDDTPFFRRRRYEGPTTRFMKDHYWSGKTRKDAVIRTAGGGIAVPKDSSIDKAEDILGPVVYIISGELEPRGGLTLFDSVIDQPLRSVRVTRNGEITGFSARGGAVKMEMDGVAFTALAMMRGMSLDPASKDYTDPYREYIHFECAGIEPLRIDGTSLVTFTGGEKSRFTMTIEEDGYGFHGYTLRSSGGKFFTLEHPSLEGETAVHQVRFDRLYDKVLAYTVDPGDEETVIPYEEGSMSVEGKSDEELFAELLREALWRNHSKRDE